MSGIVVLLAAAAVGNFAEIGPEEYRPLRRELRAFHPDESRHTAGAGGAVAHEPSRR